MADYFYELIPTRFGNTGIVTSKQGVCRVVLPGLRKRELRRRLLAEYAAVAGLPEAYRETAEKIAAYFAGERVEFDCPLDLSQVTVFQREVYRVLRSIPYGQVRPYSWVAQQIGQPAASRAVGVAVAKNPLGLIIPCHRVIRADGTLAGFSAPGGVLLKKRMLALELLGSKDERGKLCCLLSWDS